MAIDCPRLNVCPWWRTGWAGFMSGVAACREKGWNHTSGSSCCWEFRDSQSCIVSILREMFVGRWDAVNRWIEKSKVAKLTLPDIGFDPDLLKDWIEKDSSSVSESPRPRMLFRAFKVASTELQYTGSDQLRFARSPPTGSNSQRPMLK